MGFYIRMSKQTDQWIKRILVAVSLGVIVAGFIWLIKSDVQNNQQTAANLEVDLTDGSDWVRGNEVAEVVVVEYSDFQCPACAAYEPVVDRMLEELGDQVALVYRHYPLTSIHKNAQLAAQAAEAAGLQGKFWEMHDKLFLQQTVWSEVKDPTDIFVEYALDIGVEKETFLADLTSDKVKDLVAEDVATGNRFGVQGTPTFYVNGKKMPTVRSYNEFLQFVKDQFTIQ